MTLNKMIKQMCKRDDINYFVFDRGTPQYKQYLSFHTDDAVKLLKKLDRLYDIYLMIDNYVPLEAVRELIEDWYRVDVRNNRVIPIETS